MEELAMAQTHLILRQAGAWITSVHEDPACDYLETRTGCEVRRYPIAFPPLLYAAMMEPFSPVGDYRTSGSWAHRAL
jgi:hypothetical protein